MNMKQYKHLIGYVAIALVCVMLGSALTLTLNPSAQAENSAAPATVVVQSPFTAAIAQVRGSVVGVNNYQTVRYSTGGRNYFGFGYGYGYDNGQSKTQEVLASTGSAVVIGPDYVLTNYHVVEDASKLEVSVIPQGKEEAVTFAASLVASDENLDIAILYAPGLNLEPVTLGDSDSMQVGDWTICIGNPLGEQFSGTVTVGIVSALNRAVSSTSYDKYGRRETITNAMIQTDAAINAGNSGGGMFNVNGELMGIPTLKYSGSAFSGSTVEGIGMCIPINAAKPLIEDVLSGKITAAQLPESTGTTETVTNSLVGKPRLGVTIADMNANSYALRNGDLPNGVYIKEVEKNGPADKAGLQAGDIIVDANDTIITSSSQLQTIIAASKEGDVLHLKVYRVPGLDTLDVNEDIPDGEYIDVDVTLAIVDDVKQ